jgi:hypothetical protein
MATKYPNFASTTLSDYFDGAELSINYNTEQIEARKTKVSWQLMGRIPKLTGGTSARVNFKY